MTRDLFRRRIVPILFGVAIALLGRETCTKQQRTHATIVVDFGDAVDRVRAVDADLIGVDGSNLGHFHRAALPGMRIGEAKLDASLPDADAELDGAVELGDHRQKFVRHIHADDGAIVTIALGPELH